MLSIGNSRRDYMTSKHKIIIILILLITAFSIGRYSVSSPDVKTVESVVTDTDIKIDKDTHKVTIITKDPSGKETTTITEDSKTKTDKTKNSTIIVDQTSTSSKRSTINISALAGIGLDRGFIPSYGLSVTKEILGPITIGTFILINGTLGISIGLNF